MALDPTDLKARKAVERLLIEDRDWAALEAFYGESESWNELVRLLSTLTGTMKEPDVKVDLLLRTANIIEERLEDTPRAEREYERVLEIDPKNANAARGLEPIYRANGKTQNLRDVLELSLIHI